MPTSDAFKKYAIIYLSILLAITEIIEKRNKGKQKTAML
jgi:hypothetical protein